MEPTRPVSINPEPPDANSAQDGHGNLRRRWGHHRGINACLRRLFDSWKVPLLAWKGCALPIGIMLSESRPQALSRKRRTCAKLMKKFPAIVPVV